MMSELPDNPERPRQPRIPKSAGPRAAAVDVVAASPPKPLSPEEQSPLAALREAALRAAGVIPVETLPRGEQPRFWLRPSDQQVVAFLTAVLIALMGAYWIKISDWGRKTVEVDRIAPAEYEYLIDVNRATWVEWAQFEGIGEALARRIVDDREQNGPFRSVDDVRLAAMRKYLRIDLDLVEPGQSEE
jgi:hypothetical protein